MAETGAPIPEATDEETPAATATLPSSPSISELDPLRESPIAFVAAMNLLGKKIVR